MKATFTALGAVRSTLEYFLSEAGYAPREDKGAGKRARYYAGDTGEHLHASAWLGRGAEALGLTGRVRARDFERVLHGEVPGTDVVLRRNRDGAQEHRTGWDLTFSAPKSVSVAWGVQGDERVLEAFVEAVRSALRVLEARHLETRVYDPETKRRAREPADALVAATFVHVSNRNDEPQLHVHAVVVNMTRGAGRDWRSVEPSALARHARLLGHIAGDTLAERLRGLGYALATRRIGRLRSFEIGGYPRWLLDRFSTRRREMLRHLSETGRRVSERALQAAAFATRADKSGLRTPALRAQWRAEVQTEPRLKQALAAALYASQRSAPEEAPEPSALETVCAALAHLGERTTLLRERDVLATALMLAPGRHGLVALEAALERRLRDRHLLPARAYRGGGRAFVATREFAAERALVAWMKAGRDTGRALARDEAVHARLRGSLHTAGQKDAVRLILLAPHRAVAVQGFAGTGKTTMLRAVVGLAEGMPVFGLAPSAAAARVLGHEAGVRARTVDWFLTRFGSFRTDQANPATRALARELCGDGILVVDESSMLATAQLLALTRLAKRIGVARVVLCGDHRQLQSVRPGQPFRLLQEAGMPTAVMDEIVRQRNPVIRKAVRDALSGRPGRALARLAERIEEVPAQALAETAAREFLALPDAQRADTLLVAPTNALRRDINAVVREGLVEEGRIRGPALIVNRLIDLHLTASEKAELSSYQPGDEVAFVQDLLHYRVRNAEACMVTGVDGTRVTLRHPDGTPRHIAPAGHIRYHIKLCESAPMELRAGDRIRWTHNDHRRGLLNGETATVERIGKRGVTLRTESAVKHVLAETDPQLRHIDHAWAATTHAAQGSTCARVIAVLDADPMPLTNQLTFYVQISRAREEVVLLTDDREQLVETLEEQSGERMSAHEALGATPGGGGAAARSRRRDYERVRRAWRRVRRRARNEQRPERYAQGYAAVHAQVAHLDEDDALPDYMRGFVDDWLGDHDRTQRERRDIETVMRAARCLGCEPLAEEHEAAPDGAGAATPGDGGATEALTLARGIAGDGVAYGAHFDAEDGLREAFERARATLEAAAFANEHDTVTRQAAADNTLAFYAPGYAALLERATELSECKLSLDADTRALVADVLRDQAQHRGERERIEAVIDGARTWQEDRERESNWDQTAAALLEQGRAIHADTSALDAHLRADEGLRGRFDAARAVLEAAAFRSTYQSVSRKAAAGRTFMFYASGYAALLDDANRLQESGLPLDLDTRTLALSVSRQDVRYRTREKRIKQCIEDTTAWLGGQPEQEQWDDAGAALLERIRSIASSTAIYGPHLAADDASREDLERFQLRLERLAFVQHGDIVERQATESRRDRYFVPGYGAFLDHATRIVKSRDPRYGDSLTQADTVVRQHAERRSEADTIRAWIVDAEAWRDGQAATRTWNEAGMALRVRARKIEANEFPYDRHLAEDDTVCRAYQAARAALEAAAIRDAYESVERQVAASGKIAFYAPDYAPLLRHTRALQDFALPLPEGTQALISEVVREDARRRGERERIEAFITTVQTWQESRAPKAQWDHMVAALLGQGQTIYEGAPELRPHLLGDARLHQRFKDAWGALHGASICDDYNALEREAAQRGTMPFHLEAHGELLQRVRRLRRLNVPLRKGAQRMAVRVVRENAQRRTERKRIEAFITAVQTWEESRAPEAQWDHIGAALLEQGETIYEVAPGLRPHLQGDVELHQRFKDAWGALHSARICDDYNALERKAAQRGTMPFHLEAHGELLQRVRRLRRLNVPLRKDAQRLAVRVVRENAQRRTERERIEAFITAVQTWQESRAPEAQWDHIGAALLEQGQTIYEGAPGLRPHLQGDVELHQRFKDAWGALHGAKICDDYSALEREAARCRTMHFYVPAHGELLQRVRRLQRLNVPLRKDAQRLAARMAQDEAQAHEELRHIERFFEDAERRHRERVRGSSWCRQDDALWRRANEIIDEEGPYRVHLEATEFMPERFERAYCVLEGEQKRPYALDYECLALDVKALTRAVLGVSDSAEEAFAEQRIDEPAGPDPQRALEEFFACCAFRRLERERGSDNSWNAFDEALWDHANVLNGDTTPVGGEFFEDAESRRRFEPVYADLAERAFWDVDEALREEARERETIAFHAPSYQEHLEHARWLNDSELRLSDEARTRVTAMLREDTEHRDEIERIEQFIEDVRDWKRRRPRGAQWAEAAAALLERGRKVEEDMAHLYEHLESDERLDTEFATARGTFEGARFVSAYTHVQALARKRQAMPRHLVEYGEVYFDAQMLGTEGPLILPRAVRAVVNEVLRHPPERPRAAPEPHRQHAKAVKAVAPTPPSAEGAPIPRSATTRGAAPDGKSARGTQRAPSPDDVDLNGELMPPESFDIARRQVEIERQDREAEAEVRKAEKLQKERRKSGTRRNPGSGPGM